MSEGADRCGPERWVPISGGRSVVTEAVGAYLSRVDLWERTGCCLETERNAVA